MSVEFNDKICAICFDINSEEQLYSHLNASNLNKLTECNMHKSCLSLYIKFKYNVEELVEEYFIKCPCCKADICSNLNCVNVVINGELKKELAFTLLSYHIYSEFNLFLFHNYINDRIERSWNVIRREMKRILQIFFYLVICYNLFSIIGVYCLFFVDIHNGFFDV